MNATLDDTLTVTTTVPTKVSVERIKDLLTSAFEGGSNYWIERAKRTGKAIDRNQAPFLSDAPVVKDGGLQIKDYENGGGKSPDGWYSIDSKTLAEGLVVMAQKYPKACADFINENDDAETADIFLQCVCFGETIYG